jgi:hypothetical protein
MPQQHDWHARTHFYDTHPLNEDSIREKAHLQGASGAPLTEDAFQAYCHLQKSSSMAPLYFRPIEGVFW